MCNTGIFTFFYIAPYQLCAALQAININPAPAFSKSLADSIIYGPGSSSPFKILVFYQVSLSCSL